jgi:hypothetical protein
MNAASIISPSSSTNNRRPQPTADGGQNHQRPDSLNSAALFTRHYRPLSHQSSTAGNAAAASFDRTTAHPAQSGPARERHGSSGLRSVHLRGMRVPKLVGSEPAPDSRVLWRRGGASRACRRMSMSVLSVRLSAPTGSSARKRALCSADVTSNVIACPGSAGGSCRVGHARGIASRIAQITG